MRLPPKRREPAVRLPRKPETQARGEVATRMSRASDAACMLGVNATWTCLESPCYNGSFVGEPTWAAVASSGLPTVATL